MINFIIDSLNNSFIFTHNMINFIIFTYFISQYSKLEIIIPFGICSFIVNITISILISSINGMIGIFLLKNYSQNNKKGTTIVFIQTLILSFVLFLAIFILYLNIYKIFELMNYNVNDLNLIQSFFKLIVTTLIFNILNLISQCLLSNLKKLKYNFIINIISILFILFTFKIKMAKNSSINLDDIGYIIIYNDILFFLLNLICFYKIKDDIFCKIKLSDIKFELKFRIKHFTKRFIGILKNKLSIQIVLYVFNMRQFISDKEPFNLFINLCNYYSFYLTILFMAVRMRFFYNVGKHINKAKSLYKDMLIIVIINIITSFIILIFKNQILFLFLSKNVDWEIINCTFNLIIIKFLFFSFRFYIQMMLRIIRLDNHYWTLSSLNLILCTVLSFYGYYNNYSMDYYILLLFIEEILMLFYILFYKKEFYWKKIVNIYKVNENTDNSEEDIIIK